MATGQRRKSTNAEHSATTDRMRAASVRAFDAYAGVQRKANRILEELDEVTAPHGMPTIELHDEDSAVHALEDAQRVHGELAAVKAG